MTMIEDIPHTNPAYDREMAKMLRLLDDMEAELRTQLTAIEAAFASMDLEQARAVWRNDLRLNEMEGKALRQAIAVLACYQPVASDLRTVIGVLYVAAEYERIGDYVKNFAKSVVQFVKHDETLKVFPTLLEMVREVRGQFDAYLAAVAADDLDAAVAVWEGDKRIDKRFDVVTNEAVDNQSAGDGNAYSLVHTMTIATSLERMGDRVKNLVEIFYYRKTGRRLEE